MKSSQWWPAELGPLPESARQPSTKIGLLLPSIPPDQRQSLQASRVLTLTKTAKKRKRQGDNRKVMAEDVLKCRAADPNAPPPAPKGGKKGKSKGKGAKGAKGKGAKGGKGDQWW